MLEYESDSELRIGLALHELLGTLAFWQMRELALRKFTIIIVFGEILVEGLNSDLEARYTLEDCHVKY